MGGWGNDFPFGKFLSGAKMSGRVNWVVVSNIFYFHPYLEMISTLTNIFQMGWNHHLVFISPAFSRCSSLVTWSFAILRRSRWTWRSETRAESPRKGACGWDGYCRLGALLIVYRSRFLCRIWVFPIVNQYIRFESSMMMQRYVYLTFKYV